MKKIYFFLLLLAAPVFVQAQCTVQAGAMNVTCTNSCDGTLMASPGGTGPYSYVWQPGGATTQNVYGVCAGTYTVTMLDSSNGCIATATVNIVQPLPLYVSITVTPASCQSCCDGSASAQAVGGVSPYTYMWMPNSTFGPVENNLCPGTYTCCVTDANGCFSCNSGTVSFTTGVPDLISGNGTLLFPNPASGSVTVRKSFETAASVELSLCTVQGQTVFTKKLENVPELNETLDTGDLAAGMYFVVLKTSEGTFVDRFQKQ